MRGRGILMSRANSLMLDALFLFTFFFVGGGLAYWYFSLVLALDQLKGCLARDEISGSGMGPAGSEVKSLLCRTLIAQSAV